MQSITPELESILKSHFQAGARGFRCWASLSTDGEGDTELQPTHVSIDKSRRMVAAAAEIEIANDLHDRGWTDDDLVGRRVRVWQWYGDDANQVETFHGIVDEVAAARDPDHIVLRCRDRMALALDEPIRLIAPQGADEDGADRTTDNYVYLGMEVDAIIGDLLDKVGWPSDARDIQPTSYVVTEFLGNDNENHAAAMLRAALLVGYELRADESGNAVFRATGQTTAASTGDSAVPVHTFRPGFDMTSVQRRVDLYDTLTRVKVTGPFITVTLDDAWTELWHTNAIRHPVGLRYVSGEALRVLDRVTKKLYWFDEATKTVIADHDLSALVPHPAGLSGDPADGSRYYALNAPWVDGGPTTGNELVILDHTTNGELDRFALRNGRLTAIKADDTYIYVTDWDTSEIVRIDRTDGSEVLPYTITLDGEPQLHPTGLMIDGTNFWYHFDGQARFLKAVFAAPGSITGVVATTGSSLVGGEMNTDTHTECYGDSDALGLVAKFTLAVPVENQTDVSVEVVDSALEDLLGERMGISSRTHSTSDADDIDAAGHDGMADHAYAVRRETIAVDVITSMAQARETALRRLAQFARFAEVIDAGVIGHPGLQVGDLVAIRDPLTGLDRQVLLDTYRTAMDAEGTYVGTIATLPWIAGY